MRSLLKALGVTIWGTIAFGLLITFVLLGYRAGMRYRIAAPPMVETEGSRGQPSGNKPDLQSSFHSAAPPTRDEENSASATNQAAVDAAHEQLRSAADQQQYVAALAYGKELLDNGSAGPDDLRIIAQSYYSTKGCEDALPWIDKAIDAFLAANRELDESLRQIKIHCGPQTRDRSEAREQSVHMSAEQKERAEADRKKLAQLEDEAEKSPSGNLDVRLGELYFGYGDYQYAVAAIQRGLEKGQITHLDDAYVYLGRSQVALKNNMEARLAFGKLKDVPYMSPRVLRLWQLYADTLR